MARDNSNARGDPFRGHFDSLHAQPFSEFFRTEVMEETETHTSMIQACDSDSTRNRLASIVIGVILKLEINHHFITHNTVECSPRHTACSNQTQRNNLARIEKASVVMAWLVPD